MKASDPDLIIREFIPGDEIAFRRLNEEWISRDFALESKDEEAFANPGQTILKGGGRIFFAVQLGKTVGCCALLAMASGEYEVGQVGSGQILSRSRRRTEPAPMGDCRSSRFRCKPALSRNQPKACASNPAV